METLIVTQHFLDKNAQFDRLGIDAVASLLEYQGAWKLHVEHMVFPLLA